MSFIIQPMFQVKFIRTRAASSHRRAAIPVNKQFIVQVARISNKGPRRHGFIVARQADWPDDSAESIGAGGQSDQIVVGREDAKE